MAKFKRVYRTKIGIKRYFGFYKAIKNKQTNKQIKKQMNICIYLLMSTRKTHVFHKCC